MKKKTCFWLCLSILGSAVVFTGGCSKTRDPLPSISDYEGNEYNIVTIGTQVWTKENLKSTRLNDGTQIPVVTDNTAWQELTTPGLCWLNNDEASNKNIYGGLYNWYTVNSGKLCPTGWHVPTDSDWAALTTYLGGASVAGAKLKESGTKHWMNPNMDATNETGFTAVPGGCRSPFGGIFLDVGEHSFMWSATEYSSTNSIFNYIHNHDGGIYTDNLDKKYGLSVRCIKD